MSSGRDPPGGVRKWLKVMCFLVNTLGRKTWAENDEFVLVIWFLLSVGVFTCNSTMHMTFFHIIDLYPKMLRKIHISLQSESKNKSGKMKYEI